MLQAEMISSKGASGATRSTAVFVMGRAGLIALGIAWLFGTLVVAIWFT